MYALIIVIAVLSPAGGAVTPCRSKFVKKSYRLIGSIRRECTDHLIVLNEEHLRRILAKFSTYYNGWRPHVSLGKDAPNSRPIERFGDIVAHAILGGLHHRYARI